jgi:cation:H+ antiporter
MLLWLSELTVASFVLAYGAEHLSKKYGAKFVGRTLLSVATTLPEIAIVIYAAAGGFYGTAIGAGLGSNLLMMTLGLSIMLLIATTRLSKAPLKGVDVATFKLDKIFLLATAVISAALFIDGYNFIDGFIFAAMFGAYLVMALMEMKAEKKAVKIKQEKEVGNHPDHKVVKVEENLPEKGPSKEMIKAMLAFAAGTAGIFFGAGPFIHSLEGFSVEVGLSVIVLAVIISPIAGEMPEKISMMLLARKGAAGASIAVANVLGSKVLNNTLLLAVAVFGAMYHGGFYTNIEANPILQYQMILVTSVTILALIPMFMKKEIGLKVGIMLAALYIISMFIQFLLPQDLALH